MARKTTVKINAWESQEQLDRINLFLDAEASDGNEIELIVGEDSIVPPPKKLPT